MEDDKEESPSREVALRDQDEAAETVRPLEAVKVAMIALKAALACTGAKRTDMDGKKHDVPEHLQGVNIASREDEIRISATDGHRLFAFSQPAAGELPEWLTVGATVSLELLKDQLGMIEKVGSDIAVISYQIGAPKLLLADPHNNVTFRTNPVQGDYPNYDSMMGGIDLSGHSTFDLESTSFQASYFKGVADLAKMLDSRSVQIFNSAGEGKPTLITFPGCPGAVLVLMPVVIDDMRIAPQTARVISGPIAGTLAALRAHRTRWDRKLAKMPNNRSIQKKVEEYDQRIGAIVARTAPALPAPRPDPESATETDQKAVMRLSEADKPVTFVSAKPWPEPEPEPIATKRDIPPAAQLSAAENRAKLKGGAATKARAKFNADVNAVLSRDNGGLTIHQLADGVPLDNWWEIGLSPEQAAVRCLDWRTVPETGATGTNGTAADEGTGEDEPGEDEAAAAAQ